MKKNGSCLLLLGVNGVPGEIGPSGLPGIPGLDGCNGTDVRIFIILYSFYLQVFKIIGFSFTGAIVPI